MLSVIGGWIQWAPLWHPVETWLDTLDPTTVSAMYDEMLAQAMDVVRQSAMRSTSLTVHDGQLCGGYLKK